MTRSPWTYRCHTCGERITTGWEAAQRHADTHPGGARIDLDLEATR